MVLWSYGPSYYAALFHIEKCFCFDEDKNCASRMCRIIMGFTYLAESIWTILIKLIKALNAYNESSKI